MTETLEKDYNEMSLSELNQLDRDLSKKISELSNEMLATGSESKMDEYNALYSKRRRVNNAIEGYGQYERLHGHKRPLPEVPDKPLYSQHYFDRKAALEAREEEFIQTYDESETRLKASKDDYQATLLEGSDKEIEQAYDELIDAERAVQFNRSNMQALSSVKDRALDDMAMQVYMSHSNIKADRHAVNEFFKVAQDRGDTSGMGAGVLNKYKPIRN